MSKPDALTAQPTNWHTGVLETPTNEAKPDALQSQRTEIVEYIKSRLGDLAATYADAIQSSVDTACYDHSWRAGDYSRVEKYIDILQQHWLAQQGNATELLMKVQHMLSFGTTEQKSQLKKLLGLQ